MTDTLNFIHIPKTAGTSFRSVFEKKFGFRKVMRDYGRVAPETSKPIIDFCYNENDLYRLNLEIIKKKPPLLAGHYFANKYCQILKVENMLTFIREPVSRVISEYKHFQRHSDYKGTLMDFARKPRNINMQNRYLQGVPLSAIGFIGVTEYYADSIEVFNHDFNMSLPVVLKNRAPKSRSFGSEYSVEEFNEIKQLNQIDIEMYQNLVGLFQLRLAHYKSKTPYTYGEFEMKDGYLMGWAYRRNYNEMIDVVVDWGKGKIENCIANRYHPEMNILNSPRGGFVGFKVKLPKEIDYEKVTCSIKETNQTLIKI